LHEDGNDVAGRNGADNATHESSPVKGARILGGPKRNY
jgi:hypothetical protein